MGLESQFKKEIVESLRGMVHGPIYVQKMHGNQFQTGVPDLIACISGVPVMIELKIIRQLPKRPESVAIKKSVVTGLQQDNLKKWAVAGGLSLVLYGVMRQGRRRNDDRVLCPIFTYNEDGSTDLQDLTVAELDGWTRVLYYEGKGLWSTQHILRAIKIHKDL